MNKEKSITIYIWKRNSFCLASLDPKGAPQPAETVLGKEGVLKPWKFLFIYTVTSRGAELEANSEANTRPGRGRGGTKDLTFNSSERGKNRGVRQKAKLHWIIPP